MKALARKPTAAQQISGLNKSGFRYFDFGTLRPEYALEIRRAVVIFPREI